MELGDSNPRPPGCDAGCRSQEFDRVLGLLERDPAPPVALWLGPRCRRIWALEVSECPMTRRAKEGCRRFLLPRAGARASDDYNGNPMYCSSLRLADMRKAPLLL